MCALILNTSLYDIIIIDDEIEHDIKHYYELRFQPRFDM